MGAVAGGGVERLLSTCTAFQLPSSHSLLCPRRISLIRRRFGKLPPRRPPLSTSVAAVLGSSPPANKSAENDVLQTFLKERELSGDIITKVSDIIWLRKAIRIDDEEADVTQQSDESMGDESEGGYLKLTRTHDWVAGDNSAPVNKKMFSKELQNDSDRRKTLNLLRYEALKREMLLLTVGIGTFCSGYCFLALSAQAAMSYGTGVLFSCIYLQLLYKYVDNLSKEMVPQIFRLKKSKNDFCLISGLV
ncbi:uncharacterized protein LOC127797718 isoform X2 [Diospyros lotus]|uniref:uncharacterized protein LOC127797718 isoform X2 n=1 Tax=Diospyros lotus TaxID=55363 RepID=UPI00224E91CA|nr:uncharacterized protein LOC127797718 isoform X2 [Diospyros lotus]